jgi:hypothetical protein
LRSRDDPSCHARHTIRVQSLSAISEIELIQPNTPFGPAFTCNFDLPTRRGLHSLTRRLRWRLRRFQSPTQQSHSRSHLVDTQHCHGRRTRVHADPNRLEFHLLLHRPVERLCAPHNFRFRHEPASRHNRRRYRLGRHRFRHRLESRAGGGNALAALTFTIDNPVPALASLSPNVVVAGTPAFMLAVTGSNFVSTSTVQWNGAARPTTYVSATSLQTAISAADIATPGIASITVFNPTPGGGTSAPVTFIIRVPPPTITLMTPSSAIAGGATFTVAITGTNFKANSLVNWDGSPRTTTVTSDTSLQAEITAADIASIGAAMVTVVNAIADGGSSAFSSFFVGQAGGSNFAYVIVNQPAQDIVFDPVNNLFYLSAGSSASTNSNTIRVLDPSTFTVTSGIPLPVASNPNRLAISDDSQFLYAGLDGLNSVQRFALPGLKTDITIPLGANAYSPTTVASDIQVAPAAPHTIAVSLGAVITNTSSAETAPGAAGLVIFDDTTPRDGRVPGVLGTGNIFSTIQWGSDATQIFAADNNDEASPFFAISVNAGGATLQHNFGNQFKSFGPRIHYDSGTNILYSDGGPATFTNGVAAGTFDLFIPSSSLDAMTPDSKLGTAFFAGENLSSAPSIDFESFDLTHFSPITSVNVPNIVLAQPTRLIRWAQNGLAAITDQGQIILLGGNFVGAAPPPTFTPPVPVTPPVPAPNAPVISALVPGSAIAGSSGFTLTINGSAFDSHATIQFNGNALATNFVSGSQLTATVAASAIATPGTASITVANPSSSGGVSSSSNFFIGTTGGTSQTGSDFAVTIFNQPVNDIKFDSLRNVLYLAVPGSSTTFPNTIAVLDPVSSTVVAQQFAGSNPTNLALSDDGQFLYASVRGSYSVQRFALPALQPEINFGLGSDPNLGPYYALDVQVAPGAPHTTAISLGTSPILSPVAQGGVAIYDDATVRPTKAPGWAAATTNLFDALQWGADATALFGANLEDSGNDFYVLAVTPGGVSLTHDYPGLGNFESHIHYDRSTKLVYYDGGNVVDPSAGSNVTGFGNQGSVMVTDANLNRAYFVALTGPTTVVSSFNLTTRAPIDSITIPISGFFATHLVRWGQNGLAFETDSGQLVLVGGSFVH